MSDSPARVLPSELAAFSVALLADGDESDTWVQLWPSSEDGLVVGRDGREFQMGDALSIIAASELPLLLDVDHESEFGLSTIASGWVEELDARDDGIWGRLEYTPEGADLVSTKRFRMLSPVVRLAFDEAEKGEADPPPRATELVSVALTNRPNLRMTALNRVELAINATEEAMSEEELAELRALLGLEDDADGAALLEAVKALADSGEADDDEPPEDAENAAKLADVATLRASLGIVTWQRDELRKSANEAHQSQALGRVDLAIREGRANPAHRATLSKLASGDADDIAMFESLTSTQVGPHVGRVAGDAGSSSAPPASDLASLTESQRFAYANFSRLRGWNHERAYKRATEMES